MRAATLELAAAALAAGLTVWIGYAALRAWLGAIPADYFVEPRRPRTFVRHAARKIAGVAAIALGVVMLVTPGPGLLAIAAGLVLLDGTTERAVVRRLLRSARVAAALDALRREAGQPPLVRP